MICHHGAGYSGLTFACLAKEVYEATDGELGVLAVDARAHGKTTSLVSPGQDPPELDLSLNRLSADFEAVIETIFPDPKAAPHLLLVGHSMGGAVLADASTNIIKKGYQVTGVAVLDVVEGSAIEALPHMHALLASRPEGFRNQERAVQWHLEGHSIRNLQSARISVPSLLIKSGDDPSLAWKWRAPLKSTSPFWMSWFSGLSAKFLAVRAARLLILAGTDRLDKTLMIGQMQGKFQLEVVPEVGHMLHEDNPSRIAQILVEFWRRNDRVVAGIKKVGEA
jgi:protein phosphatase methylesterase 1